MRGLVRACHPEPTLAVTLVATLLAIVAGRGPAAVAAVAVAVLGSQLAVGWTNDWLDADRDARAGRRDKPIPAGQVSRRTVGAGALIAALATVPLALLSGPAPAGFLIGGMIAGLLYDWPLKFTAASPLPYLVAFGALAAFVAGTRAWWLIVAAALLGGGAHFINVLPDLADDVAAGVRGLPHRIGLTGSWVVGGTLLVAATAVLVFGPAGPPSWPALGVLAAAVVVLPTGWYLSRRPGSRAAFRSVLVVALADVILLLVSGTAG
ncbi:membrane protein [Rugosimonospora africana]|uniref:Membrane protein n=1 Tax=Rugosimonospora africana TaxID=556532 RepID=A0A8J3R6W4_9ACTN|nr:UbiA family prenyltransferase [Rugosimonospora africana]GIH21126.1 membrane protein [Rugosimonospora africana]